MRCAYTEDNESRDTYGEISPLTSRYSESPISTTKSAKAMGKQDSELESKVAQKTRATASFKSSPQSSLASNYSGTDRLEANLETQDRMNRIGKLLTSRQTVLKVLQAFYSSPRGILDKILSRSRLIGIGRLPALFQ